MHFDPKAWGDSVAVYRFVLPTVLNKAARRKNPLYTLGHEVRVHNGGKPDFLLFLLIHYGGSLRWLNSLRCGSSYNQEGAVLLS